MISTDKKIFDSSSEVKQRMIEYGGLVGELHIIVFNKKNKEEFKNIKISENVFVYPTNSLSRWFYVFDVIRVGKKIRKPDLITTQDPFECGFVGWRLAKYFSTKLQLQVHTDFLSPYFKKESISNFIRVFIAKFLIPRADHVRVVSNKIKQSLNDFLNFPSSKTTVLPIFVDVKKIKEASIKNSLKQKYPQFDFICLMASRFSIEKNIELVFDVMREIIKKFPKTGLVVVGDGPEKEKYQSRIKDFGLQKNIIIEGWSDNLTSYYKTADLFLITSNYEGYGLTIVEAISAGCPVISSNVGIADEFLDEKNIFELNDKKSLENKIIGAINGRIKKAEIKQYQTREEYLESYKKSWQKIINI